MMVGGLLLALEDGQGMLSQLLIGSSQKTLIYLTLGTKGEKCTLGQRYVVKESGGAWGEAGSCGQWMKGVSTPFSGTSTDSYPKQTPRKKGSALSLGTDNQKLYEVMSSHQAELEPCLLVLHSHSTTDLPNDLGQVAQPLKALGSLSMKQSSKYPILSEGAQNTEDVPKGITLFF